MTHTEKINKVNELLHVLAYRTKTDGRLNLLDIHHHSETFYCDLLNLLYDFHFYNKNENCHNNAGFDLIDNGARTIVQISATLTKEKIEHSLTRTNMAAYSGWHFLFMSLVNEEVKLRDFNNPYLLEFDPNKDIISIEKILKKIVTLDIWKFENCYSLIIRYLGNSDDDEPDLIGQLLERIKEYQKYEDIVQEYEKFIRIPINIYRAKCILYGEDQCVWYCNNIPVSFCDIEKIVMNNGKLNFPSRVYCDNDGNINIEWDNFMTAENRKKMMDEIARLKKDNA